MEMYRDSDDVVITEDYLIAGVLREKVPGTVWEMLKINKILGVRLKF